MFYCWGKILIFFILLYKMSAEYSPPPVQGSGPTEPQAQDPGKSYQYMPTETPHLISWPKIIFAGIGIGLLIGIFFFFIWDPLSSIVEHGNGIINNVNGNGNGNGIAVGEPNPNSYDCTRDVYNCMNFTTFDEAQYVFNLCNEQGAGDIHGLDSDGDGVVCESLAV
jgi:hypothetical protein